MSNKRADISQIRKYLNGELDATAMHRLEREAQDDPLLMDALEGYEQSGNNQQANLNDLQARLQKRTDIKQARVIPMWYWGIAASILLVAGISTVWYRYHVNEAPVLTAQADKTIVKPEILATPKRNDVDAVVSTPQPKALMYDAKKTRPVAEMAKTKSFNVIAPGELAVAQASEAPVIAAAPVKEIAKAARKDTADLSDMIMNGLVSEKVAIDTGKKYQVALNGRAKGVQTNPNYNAAKQPVMIQGVVISKDDGLPIPGVNIRVLGSTTGAVTDVNGKFALSAAKDKTVAIASLGYESEQLNLNGKDSVKIALRPSNNSLNEVVVTNSGNLDRDIPQYGARPQNGWSNFKKYLKENSLAIDGIAGTVKIQFIVDQYGQLSDFKIVKSLNTGADARAISLVKNGPSWMGNTNRKPEVVKVKINFRKLK